MGKLNKIEIENRIQKIDDDLPDFFMVQLFVDDKPINFHDEPISNYDFWENMLELSQRAIYRIKQNNPKMNFNFMDFGLMDENMFAEHLKKKYPEIDIDTVLNLFDEEVKLIRPFGPDDDHPNPEIRYPIDSDLTKNVFISLLDKINKKNTI